MDYYTLLILVKNDLEGEFIHFLLDNKFDVDIVPLHENKIKNDLPKKESTVFTLNISEGNSHDQFINWVEANLEQPIIIIDQGDYNWEQFQVSEHVSKQNLETAYQEINNIIGAFKLPSKNNEQEDYSQVVISNLQIFETLESDVFIELKTGRKLKIFSRGDSLTRDDIDKYKKRGVNKLYFKTEKLKATIDHIEKNISTIEINKKIRISTPSPSDKTKKVQTISELMVDQHMSGAIEAQAARLKKEYSSAKASPPPQPEEEAQKQAQVANPIENYFIKEGIDFEHPFQIEKAKLITLKQISKDIFTTSISSPLLEDYYVNLTKNEETLKYVKQRIGIISNILMSISKELDWGTQSVIERFLYAAITHDISLFERLDLLKLQFEEDLEDLSAKDKEIFYAHPLEASKIINEDRFAPPNITSILEQHHERLDGSGFPNKLNKHKINPYSAAFIMSINFAQYILGFPNWNIKEYLLLIDTEYKGGNFVKPLKALEELCKSKLNT